MKKRIYYLDVIRSIACLMVILMHAPGPDDGLSGIVVVPLYQLTAPCIGLFFMVSGALLLPTKENGMAFFKKRILKVGCPILFWTAVSIIISGFINGWPSPNELIRKICSIPFNYQGHPVFWFMYVLLGMYLLAPIISPWLQRADRKELRFYLIIWAITMCYPFLKTFVDIKEDTNGVLYYFSGYVGYFILGYYLRKYVNIKSNLIILWIPFALLLYGACKFDYLPFDHSNSFWYLSIITAISCCVWFCMIKKYEIQINSWSDKWLKFISHFSNCSFGIYLMHIFIMRSFLWNILNISVLGGGIALAVSFFGTLILSYGITTLISYLPFSNYIIGYKRK